MRWPVPLPVQDKPIRQLPPLPTPKNRLVAALMVLMPTLGMLGVGAVLAWAGVLASYRLTGWPADVLRNPVFLAAFIIMSGLAGTLIGLQSLIRIMHYVSLDAQGLVISDGLDSPKSSS